MILVDCPGYILDMQVTIAEMATVSFQRIMTVSHVGQIILNKPTHCCAEYGGTTVLER